MRGAGRGDSEKDLDGIWNRTCAVTGCSARGILRASHIQPWAESNDKERLDPENGLLLAAHLDALFDAYLISFKDDGRMLVSSDLRVEDRYCLRLDGACLRKQPSIATKRYLAFHRKRAMIT